MVMTFFYGLMWVVIILIITSIPLYFIGLIFSRIKYGEWVFRNVFYNILFGTLISFTIVAAVVLIMSIYAIGMEIGR